LPACNTPNSCLLIFASDGSLLDPLSYH
jgi:hypothetical protein